MQKQPSLNSPRQIRRDPFVAGVMRADAALPKPDRSVLRLRYGLESERINEDEIARRVGLTVRELWRAESAALEAVGFTVITDTTLFQLLEALA